MTLLGSRRPSTFPRTISGTFFIKSRGKKGSELFYMLIRQVVSGVLLLHLLVENAIFLAKKLLTYCYYVR